MHLIIDAVGDVVSVLPYRINGRNAIGTLPFDLGCDSDLTLILTLRQPRHRGLQKCDHAQVALLNALICVESSGDEVEDIEVKSAPTPYGLLESNDSALKLWGLNAGFDNGLVCAQHSSVVDSCEVLQVKITVGVSTETLGSESATNSR